MELISDTKALAALCKALAKEAFVTVDTEFMRESTSWPDLCLLGIRRTGDQRPDRSDGQQHRYQAHF